MAANAGKTDKRKREKERKRERAGESEATDFLTDPRLRVLTLGDTDLKDLPNCNEPSTINFWTIAADPTRTTMELKMPPVAAFTSMPNAEGTIVGGQGRVTIAHSMICPLQDLCLTWNCQPLKSALANDLVILSGDRPSQQAPNPPEFAQPRLSGAKEMKAKWHRTNTPKCVASHLGNTSNIGTNTPKFVPSRWGGPPLDPTQTGLCKFGGVWSSLTFSSPLRPRICWRHSILKPNL